GLPAYTPTLEENLFEPLSAATIKSMREGDGGELSGSPSKMQAVHSSSTLGVNIFQYWQSINQPEKIAEACRFCNQPTAISQSIRFEAKYPIDDRFRMGPNIDVVIENDPSAKHKVYAIECKFTEAYGGRGHGGIKEKYLGLDLWKDIPHLHKLAILTSPNDIEYQYLHAAQLTKHILGLKRAYGKTGFRLLYLWYDALGYAGGIHREEIERFIEIAKADGIYIHSISYQELIFWMSANFREDHQEYVDYISNRYL
ncbi:MAG: hypothetical protein ABFS17_01735, partial [Chloroflexota bacterium]